MADSICAITMPKWGLSMDEGTVAEWKLHPGDAVKKGDEIVYIETSKIAGALESPAAGLFRRQVAAVGATLPVGALLGVLADASTSDAAIDAFVEDFTKNFVPEAVGESDTARGPSTVTIGEFTIAYTKISARTPGTAAPAVFVHGFGGDSTGWALNLDALAADRDVFAVDLPGHGQSTKNAGSGLISDFASVLNDWCAAAGIARAHWIGHSFGAAVILALALEHSARVASLAMLGPAGLGDFINQDYIDRFVAAERRKDMQAALELLFADSGRVTRNLVEETLKYKRIDGVGDALRTIAAAAFHNGKQSLHFRDRVSKIAVPMLWLWGAADSIVSPSDAKGLPAAVKAHVLDNTGHMPQIEAASEVNALLREHLRTGDPR